MASQSLAIELGVTGQQAVASAFKGVESSIAGLGKVATAPLKALGGLGSALGDITKNAVAFAAGGALAQAPGMLLEMAKGAAADEQATQRLQATMAKLPGNFNDISKAVDGAIASGQKLAFSDDDIRDSFQFLAQATGTSEEALKRQKIALDLARGANIPLAQATKLVGKVNEENVDTFKKLGINIKEGASEAEALATIQAKFAGQAEAYADSTAGQFEQAQLAIGEIQESIGSALLPVLAKVGTVLADNLPAIQEFVGTLGEGVANVVGPAFDALLEAVGALAPIFDPLLAVLDDIGPALAQAFKFFTTGAGDIETFRGVLNKLIGPQGAQAVIDVFTAVSSFFRTTFLPMLDGLAKGWKQVFEGDLPGALKTFMTTMGTYGSELIQTLAEWGKRFIEWVAPLIPPLLAELGKLLADIGVWIITVAAPAIVQKLAEWALAFVKWVAPLIPPLLLELLKIQVEIIKWVGTVALPLIIEQLVKWGKAFIDWIGAEVLPKLPGELAKLWEAMKTWLTETAGKIWDGIAGGGPDTLKSKMLSGFKSAIDSAVTAVNGWIDRLVEPFRRAWNTIKDLLDKIGQGKRETEAGPPVTGAGLGVGRTGIGAITVNNTIDARGMAPGELTRALGGDLATLMRTRLVSGVA